MERSSALGVGLFMLLFLPVILLLSTRVSGPLASVISQAHLICALLVGVTYFLTKSRQSKTPGSANPSMGKTVFLTGLSFMLLVGINSLFGVVPEKGTSPSLLLQLLAIVLVGVVFIASQAIAALVSGQRVGFFGGRTGSGDMRVEG